MDRRILLATLAALAAAPGLALAGAGDTTNDALRAAERRGRGRLGVCAVDGGSGRRIVYRSGERFPLASTFKLPLVIDVLRRVDARTEHLNGVVAFDRRAILPYSPVVTQHAASGRITVSALCAAAIQHSDNTAANLLLARVGGPAGVTAYLRSIGDRTTRIDRNEPAVNVTRPGDPSDTTTPAAMAEVLVQLARGALLAPASTRTLIEWMIGTVTGDARIRAGVPRGWTVGDKTGTTDAAGNDVALVWPPRRAPIALAIYLAEVRAPDAERDAAIADAARAVVHALA